MLEFWVFYLSVYRWIFCRGGKSLDLQNHSAPFPQHTWIFHPGVSHCLFVFKVTSNINDWVTTTTWSLQHLTNYWLCQDANRLWCSWLDILQLLHTKMCSDSIIVACLFICLKFARGGGNKNHRAWHSKCLEREFQLN